EGQRPGRAAAAQLGARRQGVMPVRLRSAGSRSILGMLREEGVTIGRFRVRRLMRELGLVSKQPGSHAYKQATVERPDIPNRLNR
ncbi:IS3 family transposase, partial [Pseudomonas aeruginosa]